VYGLDLVEAGPAIYIIHPVGVACVDKVLASVHLVVPEATPDAVVAAVALEVILPTVTLDVVDPRGDP
jgi:hypothetical protein